MAVPLVPQLAIELMVSGCRFHTIDGMTIFPLWDMATGSVTQESSSWLKREAVYLPTAPEFGHGELLRDTPQRWDRWISYRLDFKLLELANKTPDDLRNWIGHLLEHANKAIDAYERGERKARMESMPAFCFRIEAIHKGGDSFEPYSASFGGDDKEAAVLQGVNGMLKALQWEPVTAVRLVDEHNGDVIRELRWEEHFGRRAWPTGDTGTGSVEGSGSDSPEHGGLPAQSVHRSGDVGAAVAD